MKLKQYITAGCLLAAMGLMLPSCMDLEPKAEMADNMVWNKAENFQLFANQYYGFLEDHGRWFDNSPEAVHSDYRSDLLATKTVNAWSQGTNTVPVSDANYTGNYKNIYYCNLLLKNAAGFGDQAAIRVPVAEAKFFRAYCYFNLVQLYGNVALLTEPIDIDSDKLYGPRDDRGAVIDQCIQDLIEAEGGLPDIPTAEGRLCKDAARAMLSRVALYEGTWQKFHTDGPNATSTNPRAASLLKTAADAAKRVITANHYKLFYDNTLGIQSYRYLFILEDEQCNPAGLQKSANKETILARRHRMGDKTGRNITHAITTSLNFAPTSKLADMYLCQNGLPISMNGSRNPQFQGYAGKNSEYTNRDNRMITTLLAPDQRYFDNDGAWRTAWNDDDYQKCKTAGAPASSTGYLLWKWASERHVEDYFESYDFPVLRLAEVYLNYTEAMFELNNRIDDPDLKWLNEVRKRVNKTMPDLTNSLVSTNGLSMREEIRRERTVELFMEGFRLDDLKRWATAPQEMSQDLTGIHISGTWYETNWANHGHPLDAEGRIILYTDRSAWKTSSKLYLCPLPSDQLQLNPQLGQNPGW